MKFELLMVFAVCLKQHAASECPTTCPARDVMVCARCMHGIYKTFPSACHVRMFNCKYKDEKMELVSRLPCIMSSPMLSSDGVHFKTEGKETDQGDEDMVLRYLHCKMHPPKSDNKNSDKIVAKENKCANIVIEQEDLSPLTLTGKPHDHGVEAYRTVAPSGNDVAKPNNDDAPSENDTASENDIAKPDTDDAPSGNNIPNENDAAKSDIDAVQPMDEEPNENVDPNVAPAD